MAHRDAQLTLTATNRAFNAVMKALARAVPEKVIAIGFDTTTGPYLSRRSEAGYKVYHEVVGGGYGASARADGCSGVDGPLGNCSNVPVDRTTRIQSTVGRQLPHRPALGILPQHRHALPSS